ncbi:MAG: SPASM domain-containing protein [Nitrospinae bacterium]|nr:SPASM domain-containing protein [Nitrospinota bacterium]
MRTNKFIQKDISFEIFKKYLSNFHPEMCYCLLLSDFGEPFLRKDLVDILRYVKSEGFERVDVVSNGTLFQNHDIKAIVKERLLRKISISLEAATKERFEDIRGTNFNEFISNIILLRGYKEKFKSKYPDIFLSTVCMKTNLLELPKIMDLAHELRIDFVDFVHLNSISLDMFNLNMNLPGFQDKLCISGQHLDTCDSELVKNIFRQIHEKSLQYNITYLPPENYLSKGNNGDLSKTMNTKCEIPYKWIQIGSDGSIFPCCQISKRIAVGNLNDSTFEQIWDNEKFKKFRSDLETGTPNDWCKICNVYKGKRF